MLRHRPALSALPHRLPQALMAEPADPGPHTDDRWNTHNLITLPHPQILPYSLVPPLPQRSVLSRPFLPWQTGSISLWM